jgi:Zn-dependent M28 family amino/carboxypeptidase
MLNVLGYVFAGLCLPLLAGWFFKNEKRYVEGANDNLSGCFTAMAVPKFLQGADAELENTELVVLCTGSGEAGLRGAKAFFKAHSGAFDDMETVFIAVDTVTDFKYMGVFITDMTNIVQHDPAVCAMMRTAANAAGYELPYENLFFGASDAAAATQAGMRAAAFGAMDPAPAPYYHTRLDTAARLEPKTIEAALEILLEVCRQYDATGLAPFEDSKVAKVKH